MGQEAVEKFFGRILTDDQFRYAVRRNFNKVCAEEGYLFTDEERETLQQLDFRSLESASRLIDRGLKRSVAYVQTTENDLVPAGINESKINF